MHYRFDAFEVDAARGRLLRNAEVVPVTGKAFEVLLALVEARGELVEKDALIRRLWPDTTVEEGNLTQQISTLRKVLGESPNEHRFIVTVARRGYRFVAPVTTSRRKPVAEAPATVGRAKEVHVLERAFAEICSGRGMLVCVAGEAGIGKSTLVGQVLDTIEDRALVLRGRCSERLTPGEAHLPVLEALESLFHGDADPTVAQLLLQRAPSWFEQIAPLPGDRSNPGSALHATQERQKRELARFFENLSETSPIVLWLDDIHWADPSTLDLIVYLTTRCETTRLLLIGSYRPDELLLGQEPFVQSLRDLRARGHGREVTLDFLTRRDVDEYLSREFRGHAFPDELAALLHQRTEGNPLFLTDLVRDLKERGEITADAGIWKVTLPLTAVARDFPVSIRNLIDRTIERLDPANRQILVTGSVQGVEFDSAVVARASTMSPAEVEERLARLARVHNIIRAVASHDPHVPAANERYAFVHVLHHEALYETLVPSRRAELSGAVADALRAIHDGHPQRIAHQLALLFEGARRPLEAVDFFLVAAQQAVRVSASREGVSLALRGLAVVASLPASREVRFRELQLLITLGVPLAATSGFANPEVERTYERARALCRELDEPAALFPVLWGLWVLFHVRADLPRALEAAREAFAVAEKCGDRRMLFASNVFLGYTRGHMGELQAALDHLTSSEPLFEPDFHAFYQDLTALNPLVASLAQQGRLLALLGQPDAALAKAQQAVDLARELQLPNAIGFTLVWASYVHQLRGEVERVHEVTGEALAIATEHGLADVRGWAAVLHAWSGDDSQAGLGVMRYSLEAQRRFGSEIARPHQLALVAEVQERAGDLHGALSTVDEALEQAARTGDVYYEAELHRMRAGLVLRVRGETLGAEALASLTTSIDLARRQGARLFEERAISDLASFQREETSP